MMNKLKLSAVAMALILAGCAHMAPDQNPLAKRDAANVQLSSDIKLAREGWPEAQWWTAYHDAQLDALIKQALSGNPSLDKAAAQISRALSGVQRSAAELGMEADVYATANRQRYSGTGLFPAPIGGAYFSEETLRLEARYNFDWWGKNKAQIAAAVGQVNAGRASYAQAEQALSSAIAQSYFRLQGNWARSANLAQMIEAQNALVQDKARRIQNGLANADEQRAAETELRLMQKQQAQISADIAREREALRALLGVDGSAATADADALVKGLQPRTMQPEGRAQAHALPERLGLELLARRPDLQAARWRVQAALSQIDVTKAAFYPDVNLSGSIGLDSISYEHLLSAPSRTLFLGPTLTLPLFDSQRLNAELASARSARNEVIADYNLAVVQAARDVAQDAVQLQGIEQQIARQQDASASAAAQLRSAQSRLQAGLADNGSVLNARLALLRQQDADLSLQQMQLLAEVALTNALGGGYRDMGTPPAVAASSK
jgi:multidrug efflux system outer membrane protein